jgi:pimeloyl-ACP methyl ester carboxylesterase
MRFASLFPLLVMLLQCARTEGEPPRATGPATASVPAPKNNEGPLRIETLEADGKPPVYALRGGPRGPERLVFLHGMCGDGLGYAQSFQNAAARRGTLIAPQADIPCEGGGARWSKYIDALDSRITAAFRALGHQEPIDDMLIIGYSQGATRAEALARKFPERYTRLILMGGPYAADPKGLETLRGALAMAGERDRLDLMQASARVLKAAQVPATFLVIPEATHGSMGPHPEKTMDEAFAWLAENQRSRPGITSTAVSDGGR